MRVSVTEVTLKNYVSRFVCSVGKKYMATITTEAKACIQQKPVYIIGCTKSFLEILTDVAIEVSQNTVFPSTRELHYSLSICLLQHLSFLSLLPGSSLLLYPFSNVSIESSQFLLLFLINCYWLNTNEPSLIYRYFKLLKDSFTCFLISLFPPHIPDLIHIYLT